MDRSRAPYQVSDERPPAGHCFLAPGAEIGEPCWGELTRVERVIPADEGGGLPRDVLLCRGHAPVYCGELYAPEPKAH